MVSSKCAPNSLSGHSMPQREAMRVECYAGYRSEETPRAFFLGERRIEVAEVLDRWLAPDHCYFKVRGDDGAVYILRHEVATGEWEMTMFGAWR
jgi:hypothetical protein